MKSTERTVLLGLIACVAVCAPVRADIAVRFRPGHTLGCARGYLRGIHDHLSFVWRAHAGQHLRVNIIGHGPTRGTLTFPSGQQDGGPGGVIFDDTVHETGHYYLRVTESTMGTAWHGRVIVKVTRH